MTRSLGDLEPGRLRVGSDEREACIQLLQDHYTDGRLVEAELSDRVERALTASTRADLAVLVEDLPGRHRERGEGGPALGRPFWLTLGSALGVGAVALSIAAVLGGATPSSGVEPEPYCASTGQSAGPGVRCPEVSTVQRRIFSDTARADQAAQQLQELADQNPGEQLTGLSRRANVLAERADNASSSSQEVVAAAGDDPPKEQLADLAKTSRQAADDAQHTVDQALDRMDR